ncbi:MAG: hypothetical protein MUP68_11840, partial [Deltaproteobacteria bacterium]|nr:hypothetical protein [Deltaproteobacteria bacterium]
MVACCPQSATVGLDPKHFGTGHEEFVYSGVDNLAFRTHGQHRGSRSEGLDRGLALGRADQRTCREAPATPLIVDGKAAG